MLTEFCQLHKVAKLCDKIQNYGQFIVNANGEIKNRFSEIFNSQSVAYAKYAESACGQSTTFQISKQFITIMVLFYW